MKLGIVTFLLLGIFAITPLVQTTYAQTDNPDRTYLHYQNNDIGMNLEYPDDWILVEDIPDVPFVARFWAPGNTGLISMDHVSRETGLSPEKIAASQVKMLESKGSDLKIIESKSLLVSDHPAWQLTYSTSDHAGRELIESKVYITNDNSRYVFLYRAWDWFPDYLPAFDSMIDSVQINSIDVENYYDDSSETSSSSSSRIIPDWMEHNARWWNEGQIDDQEMISVIEFLANNEIITMPSEKEIDLYKISHNHYADMEHYEIIKHSAWYWAESDLGDKHLLKGIKYLASINSQDDSSNESMNHDGCPQSFSSRCITGTVTEIFDGNTVRVDNALFHLALVSSPDLDDEGGQEAKEFLEQICSIGSDALVDQDDLRPLEGLSGTGRILAVVYCEGVNLNAMLVEHEFASLDSTYCHTSEFAVESWAIDGCSEKNPVLMSSEDNFDIPEVKLFLEKYPQAEIQSDRINESGFHFKQYAARDTLPGGSVWLFLVKNLETGEMDNLISCPPNQNHDKGYTVRGSENIIEYLQSYNCLLDGDVGKFGPANFSFVKVK